MAEELHLFWALRIKLLMVAAVLEDQTLIRRGRLATVVPVAVGAVRKANRAMAELEVVEVDRQAQSLVALEDLAVVEGAVLMRLAVRAV